MTAGDLLTDRVLFFFEEQEIPVLPILTDRGLISKDLLGQRCAYFQTRLFNHGTELPPKLMLYERLLFYQLDASVFGFSVFGIICSNGSQRTYTASFKTVWCNLVF